MAGRYLKNENVLSFAAVIGIFAAAILLFAIVNEVHAGVSGFSGSVYVTIHGERVPLPGVRIVRTDYNEWSYCPSHRQNCPGSMHVIETYTKEEDFSPSEDFSAGDVGTFLMNDNEAWPYKPVPGCTGPNGNYCPTTDYSGAFVRESPCDDLNYCGGSCDRNPHVIQPMGKSGWRWSWLNDHPVYGGVFPWNEEEDYGGGYFLPNAYDGNPCGIEYPSPEAQQQYNIKAMGYTTVAGNGELYSGCDFEWFPPEPSTEPVSCRVWAEPEVASDTPAGTIRVRTEIDNPDDWIKCVFPGWGGYSGGLCGDSFTPVDVGGVPNYLEGTYPTCPGATADVITNGESVITYSEDDGPCSSRIVMSLKIKNKSEPYPGFDTNGWVQCYGDYSILDEQVSSCGDGAFNVPGEECELGDPSGGPADACSWNSEECIRSTCECSEPDNHPPQVISVLPDDLVSGTRTNADNQPDWATGDGFLGDIDDSAATAAVPYTCDDRNPQMYTATFRDLDGCDDIEAAYIWMDDDPPHHLRAHDTLHFGIRKNDDSMSWNVYGIECIDEDLCFDPVDGWMKWDWRVGGKTIDANSSNALPESPYLYPADLMAVSKGIPPGDCTEEENRCSTPVTGVNPVRAWCDGNDLNVEFWGWYYNERFVDIQMGHELDFFGYVVDSQGQRDGWLDPSPESWWLDFDAPVVDVGLSVTSPSEFEITREVTDNGDKDSGIAQIYEQAYLREKPSDTDSQAVLYEGPLALNRGSGDDSSTYRIGFVEDMTAQDTLRVEAYAADHGCNFGWDRATEDGRDVIGSDWLKTEGNDVYGYDGMYDPIYPRGDALSQYWLGGGQDGSCIGDFGNGVGSLMGFCSDSTPDPDSPAIPTPGYNDNNRLNERDSGWYNDLFLLAENSSFVQDNPIQEVDSDNDSVDWGDDTSGVYKITGSSLALGDSDPANPGTIYNGRRLVFAETNEVMIYPDFKHDDNDKESGFLLVASAGTDIVFKGVNHTSATEYFDNVHIAIVSDGKIIVEDENGNNGERVRIDGFVFGNDVNWQRELLDADRNEATDIVIYDARYLEIFREMLGRREYDGFECGVVQSETCDGWY